MQTLVLFDIGSNRLRNRVTRICRDAGMERLQFSAFMGELHRDRLTRLRERLAGEIEKYTATESQARKVQALCLHVFPIDEGSFGKAEMLTRLGVASCAPNRWPDIMIV